MAAAAPVPPSFAETLYRTMIRLGADRRKTIDDVFRFFKTHRGLQLEEVQARMVAALDKEFVITCWKAAREELFRTMAAAGMPPPVRPPGT